MSIFPEIRTDRLLLRSLCTTDAGSIFAYRSLPEVCLYQSWNPQTRKDVGSFIKNQSTLEFNTPGWYQIAITLGKDGSLIGDCGIHINETDERIVEIAITIAPESQSKGYATEALKALLNLLFLELKKHRVYASVDPRNLPSMELFRRIGMRQEAHLVQSLWFKETWADDVIFAMLSSEWEKAK